MPDCRVAIAAQTEAAAQGVSATIVESGKDLGFGATVGRKPATEALSSRAGEVGGRSVRVCDLARAA